MTRFFALVERVANIAAGRFGGDIEMRVGLYAGEYREVAVAVQHAVLGTVVARWHGDELLDAPDVGKIIHDRLDALGPEGDTRS